MPTTVKEIFNKFNIADIYQVKWGNCIFDANQGIYIVSSSSLPHENSGLIEIPIFCEQILKKWIDKLSNFLIDNCKVNLVSLKSRLGEFWLPDENILYIGRAKKRRNNSGLGVRIHEYYETDIGESGPHSGGQWLKTLKNIDSLYVYYGYCDLPVEIESQMLEYFMSNVSSKSKIKLKDKNLPLPFANIRYKRGSDKNHAMKNQRNT